MGLVRGVAQNLAVAGAQVHLVRRHVDIPKPVVGGFKGEGEPFPALRQGELFRLGRRDVAAESQVSASVGVQIGHGYGHVKDAPILGAVPFLEGRRPHLLDSRHASFRCLDILFAIDVVDAHPQELFAGVSGQAKIGIIHIEDSSLGIDDPESVYRSLENGAKVVLVPGEAELLLPLGHFRLEELEGHLDRRVQHCRAGAFHNISIGGDFLGLFDDIGLRMAGEEYDRDIPLVQDGPGSVRPVDPRAEVDVHQDEVHRGVRLDRLDRLLAGAGDRDVVAVLFKARLLRHRDEGFVFHDENSLRFSAQLAKHLPDSLPGRGGRFCPGLLSKVSYRRRLLSRNPHSRFSLHVTMKTRPFCPSRLERSRQGQLAGRKSFLPNSEESIGSIFQEQFHPASSLARGRFDKLLLRVPVFLYWPHGFEPSLHASIRVCRLSEITCPSNSAPNRMHPAPKTHQRGTRSQASATPTAATKGAVAMSTSE